MKNSLEHIWHYFQLLDSLSYPRELIQIGILVSDSTDNTYTRALELADERQYSTPTGTLNRGKYNKITILSKNFNTAPTSPTFSSQDDADYEKDLAGLENIGKARHSYSLQIPRRKLLAKSRSWLLSSTLDPEVDFVLWLDVDVVEFSEDLIQVLLNWGEKEKADVIVPNCMWKSYNEMGYVDVSLSPFEKS